MSISAPLNYFKACESWYCGGKGHPDSSSFWWGKTLLQNGVGCYFKISPLGHDSVLTGNFTHSVTKLSVTTASLPRTQSHMIMYLQIENHSQNLRFTINHIQTDQSTLSRQGIAPIFWLCARMEYTVLQHYRKGKYRHQTHVTEASKKTKTWK